MRSESLDSVRPQPDHSTTASELLAILSARQLQEGQVVFAGVGIPLLAATLAQRLRCPGLTILFEGGDPHKPVVMGLMHTPSAPAPKPTVEGDGERLVFEAEKEIVLRCGDASITLTRAGKILIKGAYVLSRSSGVNRIQGGAVEIN